MSNASTSKQNPIYIYTKYFNDLNDNVEKSQQLTPLQVVFYGYIYGWHNQGKRCIRSYSTIAREYQCTPTTIETAANRLEMLGWITIVRGERIGARNPPNIYRIKRLPPAVEAAKVTIEGLKVKAKKKKQEELDLKAKRERNFSIAEKLLLRTGLTQEAINPMMAELYEQMSKL